MGYKVGGFVVVMGWLVHRQTLLDWLPLRLARLVSARRGVAASLQAFRDERLRYRSGLSNELDLSSTQTLLVESLLARLNATVAVNISYARLLRELLPVPRDPQQSYAAPLRLEEIRPAP